MSDIRLDLGTLNLGLGSELDLARRARARYSPPSLSSSPTSTASSTTDHASDPDSPEHVSLPLPIPTYRGGMTGTIENKEDCEKERPYPLCLLCLSRPPSAVLLPCCHLNLCYLCAPMLILRSSPSFSIEEEPIIATSTLPEDLDRRTAAEPKKIPYNVLLARATAHNPKLRLLAGGGYSPPSNGLSCGEMRSEELIPSGPGGQDDDEGVMKSSFSNIENEDGRICLVPTQKGKKGDGERVKAKPKCLVCRQGVNGWLRVYTG